MTLANFNDYVQDYPEGFLDFYENPNALAKCFFAKEFISTKDGKQFVIITFKGLLKEKLAFHMPIATVSAIAISFFTGNWGFIPTIIGSGLFGSAMMAVQDITFEVECSYEYKLWRCQLVEPDISKIFQDFLLEDDVLKDLVCPFSQDLPKFPVKKAVNGKHTYDQETVLYRLRTKSAESIAGYCEDFTEADLIFDMDHFVKVTKRIKFLVEEEFQRKDLEIENVKIIKDGLLAYKLSKDKMNSSLFNQLVNASYNENNRLRDLEIEKGSDPWTTTEQYEKLHSQTKENLAKCFEPLKFYVKENIK